jgi:hypothetical protein
MTIKQQGGVFGRNPTFNDVDVEGDFNAATISGTTGTFSGNLTVDTDTLFVDATNDRIGVGTVSPSGDGETIHINGSAANSTLHLTNTTTGSGAADGTYVTTSGNDFLLRNREAGSTILYSNNTPRVTIDSGGDVTINTGNVVMANGQGIDFSATGQAPGMTSELFDDYEEGTWTPTFQAYGGTPSNVSGKYTKIGDTVFIHLSATFDGTADGSTLRIQSVPFSSANSCGLSFAINTGATCTVEILGGNIEFKDSSGSDLTYSGYGASAAFELSGVYYV